jgi:hypothetical protein
MAHLPVVSEKPREKRGEEERRERERLAAEKRWEEEERREGEERRIKDLLGRLERWRLMRDIWAYVGEAARASGRISIELA